MNLKVETYAKHIEELCATHQITVGSHTTGGRAFKKARRIDIRPVKSVITYAIALHEIGHIVGKTGRFRMEKERFAWIWAKENALEWTDTMQKQMDKCMQSYIKWADRHKTMRVS